MATRRRPLATTNDGLVMVPSAKDPQRMLFKDPVTGETVRQVDIKNKFEGAIWDTIAIPAGLMGAGTNFNFFRDVTNKELIDTNMSSSRRLLSGTRLEVHYIGLYIPQAAGNTVARLDDAKKISDAGLCDIKLNRLQIAEKPAFMLPTGYGLVGYSSRTDTENFTLGVPSTAAIRRLLVPQVIESEQDINAVLRFDARTWDALVAMPTTVVHTHVKLILVGTMYQ